MALPGRGCRARGSGTSYGPERRHLDRLFVSVDLIGLEVEAEQQHPVTYAPRFAQATMDRAVGVAPLAPVEEEGQDVTNQPPTDEGQAEHAGRQATLTWLAPAP